ncbi:hypothetical protein [Rhizobium sp. NFR07]|uniref:hypothetical protein n=1 Tax=Rhizobium sp. NFR07 TaxID=1566262 RepID=UPI001160A6E6|nr:hypothetical protein [Rhizobium sp. NFR07]
MARLAFQTPAVDENGAVPRRTAMRMGERMNDYGNQCLYAAPISFGGADKSPSRRKFNRNAAGLCFWPLQIKARQPRDCCCLATKCPSYKATGLILPSALWYRPRKSWGAEKKKAARDIGGRPFFLR